MDTIYSWRNGLAFVLGLTFAILILAVSALALPLFVHTQWVQQSIWSSLGPHMFVSVLLLLQAYAKNWFWSTHVSFWRNVWAMTAGINTLLCAFLVIYALNS